MNPISIAIHGGAGTISRKNMPAEKEAAYRAGLKSALDHGYQILELGGSSLDAVEQVVILLENNILFNAGKGSVFTHEGTHEMDAGIMRGDTLAAGAAAGVRQVQNPISLARAIMEKSNHVMLAGPGAEEFARHVGLTFQPDDYFYDEFRMAQLKRAKEKNITQLDHSDEKKFGTVGAVALDASGNLAAATSTGGMTNKRWGRIGDSPVIGAGTYANNASCAISCTGDGEYFLRGVVAHDVSALIEYKGLSLSDACRIVVKEKLVKLGGEGGLIATNTLGEICLCYNSDGMYRAQRNREGFSIMIWEN